MFSWAGLDKEMFCSMKLPKMFVVQIFQILCPKSENDIKISLQNYHISSLEMNHQNSRFIAKYGT